MIKKMHLFKLVIFSTLFTTFIQADIYVDRFGREFTYNKSVPYRYITRVTQHKNFTNIYLDDGSVWRAEEASSEKEASRWLVNDPVILYPNDSIIHSIFHNEDYYIYNERLNSCAYANISCSPTPNDLTHLQIVEISYVNNVITVVNGVGDNFYFQISNNHINKVSTWLVSDSIILGWNKDLWTGSDLDFPYILINTNTSEFINSEFINYSY